MAGTTSTECLSAKKKKKKQQQTRSPNLPKKCDTNKKRQYLEGVAEELLSSVERHVLERMRIDLDDAIVNGNTTIPMYPTARLDALHQKSQLVAQRRIIGNDVDAQWLPTFIRQHHQLSS